MIRLGLAGLAIAFLAQPALAADGARLFALQCKMCHGPASTAMGPTLAGVTGGDIAGRADFDYSPALKAKDGEWTDANLDAYLKSPSGFAPGTKMMMAVPSEESRTAIIGHLKTLK